MTNNQLSGGGAGMTGYPAASTAMVDVVKGIIDEMDEMDDLRLFKEFVLQDPVTAEKYDQFKTFKILKSK